MAAGVSGEAEEVEPVDLPRSVVPAPAPAAQLLAALDVERTGYLARIARIEAKGPEWDRLTVGQLRDRVRLVDEAATGAGSGPGPDLSRRRRRVSY